MVFYFFIIMIYYLAKYLQGMWCGRFVYLTQNDSDNLENKVEPVHERLVLTCLFRFHFAYHETVGGKRVKHIIIHGLVIKRFLQNDVAAYRY